MKGLRYLTGIVGIASLAASLYGCTNMKNEAVQLGASQSVPVQEWNCTEKKNVAAAFGVTPARLDQICEKKSQENNELADRLVEQCGANSENYDGSCKDLEAYMAQGIDVYRKWCLCDKKQ